jgi:RNA polymerase subunit RPABC4/transcription elongation factor Spt4
MDLVWTWYGLGIVLNHDFYKIIKITKMKNPANFVNLVKIAVQTIIGKAQRKK